MRSSAPKVDWLSHLLDTDTPAYGGTQGLVREVTTQIAAGDTANTERWVMVNHLGTHLDAPRHFVDGAPTVTDYDVEHWVFDEAVVLDVPCRSGELITSAHIEADALPDSCDLVMFRTGWEAVRGTRAYWDQNPGFDASLAHWLREHAPTVRAVGLDTVSITSRLHRVKGREAHRAFLDPSSPGTPILLIEDMALARADARYTTTIVAPLRVVGADGAPCTVMAFK